MPCLHPGPCPSHEASAKRLSGWLRAQREEVPISGWPKRDWGTDDIWDRHLRPIQLNHSDAAIPQMRGD